MAWPTLTDAFIITEVRRLINEPTARRITDAQIGNWIDEAVQKITRNSLGYAATATVTLIANTVEYADELTGCITVKGATYLGTGTSGLASTATKSLLKMHPRHFSNIRSSTAGVPQEYLWFDEDFYVWPLPNVTHKVEVYYYRTFSTTMSANAFQTLPPQYEPYYTWYAYAKALMKLGKPQQAMQYMSMFDNFIAFHRSQELIHPVDSEDMMTLPDRTEYVKQ